MTNIKILGIDYGDKKIGTAISDSPIAFPYLVIRYESRNWVIKKLVEIIEKEKIEKVVIGISEGKSKVKSIQFGKSLLKYINIPVTYCDETLTTYHAQKLSFDAGIKRSKRKKLEDAYAATVMLQLYLDNHV